MGGSTHAWEVPLSPYHWGRCLRCGVRRTEGQEFATCPATLPGWGDVKERVTAQNKVEADEADERSRRPPGVVTTGGRSGKATMAQLEARISILEGLMRDLCEATDSMQRVASLLNKARTFLEEEV